MFYNYEHSAACTINDWIAQLSVAGIAEGTMGV